MSTTQRADAADGVSAEHALESEMGAHVSDRNSKRRSFAVDLAILVVCALIGAFGTQAFVAQIFSVPSGSMAQAVAPGERILAEKLSYRFRGIERGDIVVFDAKGLFVEPAPGASMFVKRVIGTPGDRVSCCDDSGRLTINGEASDETAYLYPGDAPSDIRFDVIVPPGSLWVMGDHRSDSADSRAYLGAPGGGFVPEDRVVGRAMMVIWPISSARSIDSPTDRS